MENTTKKKRTFIYGTKRLDELSYEELLDAVEKIWEQMNLQILEANTKTKAYQQLLSSAFPIHVMWREVVFFISWTALLGYFLTK